MDGETLPKTELDRRNDEILERKIMKAFLKGFLEYYIKKRNEDDENCGVFSFFWVVCERENFGDEGQTKGD